MGQRPVLEMVASAREHNLVVVDLQPAWNVLMIRYCAINRGMNSPGMNLFFFFTKTRNAEGSREPMMSENMPKVSFTIREILRPEKPGLMLTRAVAHPDARIVQVKLRGVDLCVWKTKCEEANDRRDGFWEREGRRDWSAAVE
jgi:hypothetical protein